MTIRQFLIPSLAILIGALSGVANAQQVISYRKMLDSERIFFAMQPRISKELKLTEAGLQKILDAFDGALEVEGDTIRITIHGTEDLQQMELDAMHTLSEDQRKRLEEIWIQRFGGATLSDDVVAKKLGLTDEQKTKIGDLADQGGKEVADLSTGGEVSPDDRKQIEAIRAKYAKQMLDILTPAQAQTFESLKGKPMEKESSN